jgi:hypothetical protein
MRCCFGRWQDIFEPFDVAAFLGSVILEAALDYCIARICLDHRQVFMGESTWEDENGTF